MKKILIVEDSLPILQLHYFLVKKAGFEPVKATSLAEVKAQQGQFKEFFCAIIDYSLPDAPNGEAIEYLLEHNVPGIVMTGMLDDEVRNNILRLPVIDYITKESKQAYSYLQHLIKKLQVNQQNKILVVDDSASTRGYLKHLLERHNYDVLLATCGKEALDVLEQNPDIKLVITDKEMPNMDGLELCNEIRAKYNREEMSIIGISGSDNPSLTAKFIKNGANDFLKKPFCPEEFYCRVLQNIEYIESIEIIKRQANTDYLTGLYNRRYYFNTLAPIIKSGKAQTLAMMDIDFFKSVNDTYGHDAGDLVLKTVAQLLEQHFANDFTIARLGGEEFSVFFGELPIKDAKNKLDAFRTELAEKTINYNETEIKCTISIGLTNKINNSLDGLINQADDLLYQAKEKGRNQVIAD